jgi:hypothetical protein
MRSAPARSALFEKDDAIRVWIEEATIVRHQPCAWPTMQKDDGLSVWNTALLVIELMNRRDSDVPAVVRLDCRVKRF